MSHMLKVAMFVTLAALALFLTPSAEAQTLSGGGQAYYADIPPQTCGPIDPYSPCYYPLGGYSDCPARTSYDSCMRRCDCYFKKNKEKCKQSGPCLDLAAAEKNACEGACVSDFATR